MRKTATAILTLTASAGLSACGAPTGTKSADRSAQAVSWPQRQAGVWEETLTRNGDEASTRTARVCLGAGPITEMAVLGHRMGQRDCLRALTRATDGTYHFNAVCRMGGGALISTTGVASGDFVTQYALTADVRVTNAPIAALDGQREVKISSHFRGPCPSGMKPGQLAGTHGGRLLALAGR